jgi:hypothetical protein
MLLVNQKQMQIYRIVEVQSACRSSIWPALKNEAGHEKRRV